MADAPHRERGNLPNSTYHVFNRGFKRQTLFRCAEDYGYFLGILERLLGRAEDAPSFDRHGNRINAFGDELSVIAYALMPNHFHLVIHQRDDPTAISRFMARLETAYAMYFNRKYRKKGKVYEGRYHAEHLPTARDVRNEIVYAHRNPDEPLRAKRLTSHKLYMGRKSDRAKHWCRADLGLKLFKNRAHYMEHLHDAIAHRERERERERQEKRRNDNYEPGEPE